LEKVSDYVYKVTADKKKLTADDVGEHVITFSLTDFSFDES
jgi:hypothetical protein